MPRLFSSFIDGGFCFVCGGRVDAGEVWRSEDNSGKSVLPFIVGSVNQTVVAMLIQRDCDPLAHLAGPCFHVCKNVSKTFKYVFLFACLFVRGFRYVALSALDSPI